MLDTDKHVDFVLRHTNAYNEVVAKKGKRQTVKGMVQRWRRAQEGREIVQVGGRWKDYYKPVSILISLSSRKLTSSRAT